jgi:2-polyprenyl-6-methoxyphenol hydroxylase-like FAD-dependent oxidoreductase
VEQSADSVSAFFVDHERQPAESATGSILIGCDGVHSVVRNALYPTEGAPAYHGINLWRGVTRHKPFLTGSSIARIGATESTLIVYPVRDDVDGAGNQLINWVAEVDSEFATAADWTARGRLDDFYPVYQDWTFDWLDIAELIRNTEPILAYPMVDRDPLDRWTFGRITLLGDAAHPMYPRGGNGAAQTILDARSLARELARREDWLPALHAYEADRRPVTSKVVLQNRSAPPNVIVDTVEKRTKGQRFERLEDFVHEDELREIFSTYQKVAGYHVDLMGKERG